MREEEEQLDLETFSFAESFCWWWWRAGGSSSWTTSLGVWISSLCKWLVNVVRDRVVSGVAG